MKAGCTKVDITPPVGLPIGGNVREDNIARGVHDSLFANLLYLKDDHKQLLFIGMDLVGVYESLVNDLKVRLEKGLGIPYGNIAIIATHTHSGPDVFEAFKDSLDTKVIDYVEQLKDKVIDAAVQCQQHTWKAYIGVEKGYEDSLSFNRRLFMKDGELRMNWESIVPDDVDEPAGPIDPDVFVLSVKDEQNNIRSIFVNFTLHTAVLVGKDWLYSRDYVHGLTTYLEEKFDKDLVVLFANGAEGNINHINVNDPNQPRGFEEADRIGKKLAKYISEILVKVEHSSDIELNAESKIVELPRREVTKEQVKKAEELLEKVNWKIPSLLDGVPDEAYAKEIIKLGNDPNKIVNAELQVIQIGETALVSLPGEYFVEFGLEIKETSPFKQTMILGMTNGYIGYVPTEVAFEEGGYEIKTARTSQLQPNAGIFCVKEVINMLNTLKGGVTL
jgi:neutral ceramidase